jgi:FdhD protein
MDAARVAGIPGRLRAAQPVFDGTGGLHAAALFRHDGEVAAAAEDVGRHNAVDKIVGTMLDGDRLPLDPVVLAVSGRASFELVQKACLAGIPMLVAVSAPSSLAIDLAEACGITIVLEQNISRRIDHRIVKYNGRPMSSSEIYNALLRIQDGDAPRRIVLEHGT